MKEHAQYFVLYKDLFFLIIPYSLLAQWERKREGEEWEKEAKDGENWRKIQDKIHGLKNNKSHGETYNYLMDILGSQSTFIFQHFW